MKLSFLPGVFAVCRLSPDWEIPGWALNQRGFVSITYTHDELSIVCRDATVPEDVRAERGWIALQVHGPLDFGLTGILASLTAPLTQEGIPIFAISTYDTDYLLLKEKDRVAAQRTLEQQGHIFV
ncbi:MAG TPA: ACT domain-containing protein [Ktedonobacteraceae bacterium]|jgi:hypothetical protein|nr:ACT domain-containing protein [Ktedonobacteraceae bacterium]